MSPSPSNPPLLVVDGLTTAFDVGRRLVAVDAVSFEVRTGETLALVGESGSGKSVTALSIMRLVQPPGRIEAGRILFEGRDLLGLPERDMRKLRGARLSLIFQEPATALNPVFTVGDQLAESMEVHGVGRAEARRRAIDLLDAVKVPDPARRARDYPHQLSGGLRQRVLIAMAIACRPALVMADEPTTALDVTIQAQILELLRDMRDAFHLSLLLVTHDLGIVAGIADRVAVMYAGRLVEEGRVHDIFRSPAHPYTAALLRSIPGSGHGRRLTAIDGAVPEPGLEVRGCAFAPRCPERLASCDAVAPPLVHVAPDHWARCHLLTTRRALPPPAEAVSPEPRARREP